MTLLISSEVGKSRSTALALTSELRCPLEPDGSTPFHSIHISPGSVGPLHPLAPTSDLACLGLVGGNAVQEKAGLTKIWEMAGADGYKRCEPSLGLGGMSMTATLQCRKTDHRQAGPPTTGLRAVHLHSGLYRPVYGKEKMGQ